MTTPPGAALMQLFQQAVNLQVLLQVLDTPAATGPIWSHVVLYGVMFPRCTVSKFASKTVKNQVNSNQFNMSQSD